MMEEWRITSLPGYEVSNLGRVRSVDRVITRVRIGKSHQLPIEGKILIPMHDGGGYPFIQAGRKNYKIHRLVAIAFLPNPDRKRCVNHINGKKTDNLVYNLEWCTHSENLKHAHRTGLKTPQQLGKSGVLHHGSKPLLSIKDTAIIEHESRSLCAKYLGVHVKAVNSAMDKGHYCRGHRLYSL